MEASCRDAHVFRLTSAEHEAIRNAFVDICYEPTGGRNYIQTIRTTAYRAFSERLLEKLESLKSDDASFCVFENLPVDETFGSPQHDADSLGFKNGYVSENVLVAFGSLIAEPYSIGHEGPKLVNDLVPHPEAATEYTGNGSEVELDLHTENAFQTYDSRGDTSPLALLLLGVRSDPHTEGPKTWVADAREALKALTDSEIKLLYGKHFIIRQPYRWRNTDEQSSETRLFPILSGPITLPRVTAAFYPDMVIPVDDAAKKAYAKFYDALKQVAHGTDIQPGRLVYVNNRFTLHSRDKFTPGFDANGHAWRWVQRLFLTNNLWNFRSFKKDGARIFSPVA
ncbi:oxygenase [Pseudomonas sp. MPR-ANC1]|nr:oxygenase [Pseudomonas sp. MPR-ANC1]